MQDESLNMRLQQARPIREPHGDLIWTVHTETLLSPQDDVKIDDSQE